MRRSLCIAGILLFSIEAQVDAGNAVRFDAPTVIACADVTTNEFRRSNPGERLIEAKLTVSAFVATGSENDLIEFVYRFHSPRRSMKFTDYAPRTTLSAEILGNIKVEKHEEGSQSVGATVDGALGDHLHGAGTANIGSKASEFQRYERLPALSLISSSGTIDRGNGVYFKLKPSGQSTLEGGKDFVLVAQVPGTWRSDLVQLACTATGYDRGPVRQLDEWGPCGEANFTIALFLDGSDEGKAAAQAFARAERELMEVARTSRHEIKQHAHPTDAHRVAAMLSFVDPKVPMFWEEQVLECDSLDEVRPLLKRLPKHVSQTAAAYVRARQRLVAWEDFDTTAAIATSSHSSPTTPAVSPVRPEGG